MCTSPPRPPPSGALFLVLVQGESMWRKSNGGEGEIFPIIRCHFDEKDGVGEIEGMISK